MADFIINNQLGLLVIFFLIGFTIAQFFFFGRAQQAIWLGIDTLWIVFGGSGIFVAVTLGIFAADTSRINRQTDIVYATNAQFIRDTRLFDLRYCENGSGSFTLLCRTVERMSQSARVNEDALPVFSAIADADQPLLSSQILRIRDASETQLSDNEPDRVLLEVDTMDDQTRAQLDRLTRSGDATGAAAQYEVLAETYDQLVADTNRLLTNFAALQKRKFVLVAQVVLLMFVAFFLPLRVAKGFNDLRNLHEATKPKPSKAEAE